MANLPETEDFADGIYQIETSDRVLGGPGGISNKQAEQLGNRTAWLKAKYDGLVSGAVAVAKAAALATARKFEFTGAASGNASFDGTADVKIALTLADSGVVSGAYPKVSVNAKGIVTSGEQLSAADIPALGYMLAGAGGLTTIAPSVVGKVADLPGTQFFFTTGETTDVPPGFVYSVGLHIKGPDGASVDLFSSVVSEEYCIRRNYTENPTPARRLWTSANFDPASKAPLLNPEFTGNNVRVPNVPAGANDTRAANAAFVRAAIAELVASSPAALDTLNELAAALGNDPNFATSMNNALAGKASTAAVTALTQVVSSKADQQATTNALSVLTQSVGSKADQAITNAALAGKFDKTGGTISGATTVATGAQGNNIPGLTVYNPGQANAYATLMLSTSISGAYIAHATASNTVYIRNHASGYADIDAGDIYSFGSRCHTADSFSKPAVGGWVALERVATLPAGGTWAYQLLTFNSGGQVQGSSVGIVPGGTTLGTTYSGGFAWRISP